MIERILPPAAASAEAYADAAGQAGPTGAAELYPEERALIARAVERRQREFATGRACARAALAKLGVPPGPILRGQRNAPVWPAGIVGSITHCTGYRAAVVAHARDLAGVGIDAEPNQPLPSGVLDAIALPVELDQLRPPDGVTCWDRLLFCAKEAVFKVWYPLTGLNLGFDQAHVTITEPDAFEAKLLTAHPAVPSVLAGRYLATPSHLLTAIALPV